MATFNEKVKRRLKRSAWRVISRLSPDRVETFALPGTNARIEYPVATAVGAALYSGEFEPAEIAFVRNSLKPGDVFLDIGANAGIFSVVAANIVGPKGHVHAFEPGQREFALLKKNIALNNLTNVTAHQLAISRETGKAEFQVSRDGAMSSLQKTNHPGQVIQESITIDTITLDDFRSQSNISRVDFIKIDVEGAEKLVFEGGRNLFASLHPVTILFESADVNAGAFGYTTKDFLTELRERGFILYSLDHNANLSPISKWNSSFGKEVYNFVAKTR